MKKAKMMLLSLALLAVVGAALAFKAKMQIEYCTAPTVQGIACTQLACPNFELNSTTTDEGDDPFICTTIAPNPDCTVDVNVAVGCTTTSTLPLVDN